MATEKVDITIMRVWLVGDTVFVEPGVIDKRVGDLMHAALGAAPSPLFGAGGKIRADWVHFHIADGAVKVLFGKRERGEAALPEVAAPFFAEVNGASIALVYLADGTGERLLVGRHRYQVDMIGHETVPDNAEAETFRPVCQEGKIVFVVGLAEENRLPPVPSLGYVMRYPGNDYSCYACHT